MRIMDSVNSTTFIKRPPCMTDIQEKFLYTKELLTGRIFLGCYQERRHITEINQYRDVVYISNEETDLQCEIDKLIKKWSGVQNIKWVGITNPHSVRFPKAYCFWVKLTNLAFGHYWFQIKHVKLVDEEVFLQLKCIRKYQAPLVAITPHIKESQICDNKNEVEASTSMFVTSNKLVWDFDPRKAVSTFQASCTKTIHTMQPHITWKNFLSFTRTIFALMIVIVMGIISLIGHMGEFSLKLLREFTLLVNAFTPVVVQFIDFLSKIIGGLYILVAGMFFRNAYVQPYRNNKVYSIPYSKVALRVPPRASVDWRERNQILRRELLCNSREKHNFRL